MPFQKDFVWGAATASYQIEGGWDADLLEYETENREIKYYLFERA